MEAALHSFYRNRKALKSNGVDEEVLNEFNDAVASVLQKPNDRKVKRKVGIKKTLEYINQDLKNMMEAKNTQNNEDMEDALVSFYGNRKSLKEKGFDESIMNDYDEKVGVILGMKQLSQDEKAKETMINMQYDMQNILKAKSSQDKEDMEAALHSFYRNRKALKSKDVDENVLNEFNDAVESILKKQDVRLSKSKDSIETSLKLMNQDLKDIREANNAKDNEDMEAALRSFYTNRKTLKDKGVDENVMKDFGDKVNAILKTN